MATYLIKTGDGFKSLSVLIKYLPVIIYCPKWSFQRHGKLLKRSKALVLCIIYLLQKILQNFCGCILILRASSYQWYVVIER